MSGAKTIGRSDVHSNPHLGEGGSNVFNAGFPIHWWHGQSGRVYPHSVFPLGEVPWVPEANFVLASMNADGSFQPIYVGATENLAETLRTNSVVPHALRLGATHIHIHLLGESAERRLEIRKDLRDGTRLALTPAQLWLAAS